MFRPMVKSSCLIACLLAASFALAQTEFSADIVNTGREGGGKKAKIYFGKDKMRIESAEQRGMGGAFIMDLSAHTSIVVMDQQHMYMEVPIQMQGRRDPYHFFQAGDAENACPDWLAQPSNKGGTCRKVGTETVNGRSAVKYEGTNAEGKSGTVWLDPKLRFPLKWQGENGGSGELQNIKEGLQPASLFEIPADYKKFDMGGMMQQQH
ncbi:MAG TPA: hypothetical protein VMB66_17145 [Candidatus Acidoferrales bacterium]|nr:hypothetical protein [Candidatus Acidoferrales bacterium]